MFLHQPLEASGAPDLRTARAGEAVSTGQGRGVACHAALLTSSRCPGCCWARGPHLEGAGCSPPDTHRLVLCIEPSPPPRSILAASSAASLINQCSLLGSRQLLQRFLAHVPANTSSRDLRSCGKGLPAPALCGESHAGAAGPGAGCRCGRVPRAWPPGASLCPAVCWGVDNVSHKRSSAA